ncbi:MAG: hypothetical protein WKG32_20945 [Gemmatimonadaceae bacterium]
MATPQWQPLVVGGDLNPSIADTAINASGVYAIRDSGSHAVRYVGESSRGVLWKTLLRHFQAPDSFRSVRERGIFTGDAAKYDVAIEVTSRGPRPRPPAKGSDPSHRLAELRRRGVAHTTDADQRALDLQAEWIANLKAAGHELVNVDDGTADDEELEDVCDVCGGEGTDLAGRKCAECGGSGRVRVMNPGDPGEYAGLVLLFKTTGPIGNMARLHAASCPMVNTAKRGGKVKKIEGAGVADAVEDLNDRGFPVVRCKCCKPRKNPPSLPPNVAPEKRAENRTPDLWTGRTKLDDGSKAARRDWKSEAERTARELAECRRQVVDKCHALHQRGPVKALCQREAGHVGDHQNGTMKWAASPEVPPSVAVAPPLEPARRPEGYGATDERGQATMFKRNPGYLRLDPTTLLRAPRARDLRLAKAPKGSYEDDTIRDARGPLVNLSSFYKESAAVAKWLTEAVRALNAFRDSGEGQFLPSEMTSSAETALFWARLARRMPKRPTPTKIVQFAHLPWEGKAISSRSGWNGYVDEFPSGSSIFDTRDDEIARLVALLGNLSRVGEVLRKVPETASQREIRDTMAKVERAQERAGGQQQKDPDASKRKQIDTALDIEALSLAFDAADVVSSNAARDAASRRKQEEAAAEEVAWHGRQEATALRYAQQIGGPSARVWLTFDGAGKDIRAGADDGRGGAPIATAFGPTKAGAWGRLIDDLMARASRPSPRSAAELLRAIEAGPAHALAQTEVREDEQSAIVELLHGRLIDHKPARGRWPSRYVVTTNGSRALGSFDSDDPSFSSDARAVGAAARAAHAHRGHEHMIAGNGYLEKALNTYHGEYEKIAGLHAKAAAEFHNSAISGGSLGLGVEHARSSANKAHKEAAKNFRKAAADARDKAKQFELKEAATVHAAAAKSAELAAAPSPRPAGYGDEEQGKKKSGQLRMFNPQAQPSGHLVELGILTALEQADGTVLAWKTKVAPVLSYDERRRLFVVYVGKVARPSSRAERRSYARTHWGKAGRGDCRNGAIAPGPFRSHGRGARIIYTTRKGADRELVEYVHEWAEGGGTAPEVLEHACRGCGPRCAAKGAITLHGGSYKVEDRGIVG